MRQSRVRNSRRSSDRLFDTLESRQLLANFVTTITEADGDVFQVSAENFAIAPLADITNATGALVLNIAGSTAASDIRITRSLANGDGILNLHAINVTGDIDELTTDDFVNIRSNFAGVGTSGINITGRARVITINGELRSRINIGGSTLANKTTLTVGTVNGQDFVPRGLDPQFLLPITSAGVFDVVNIGTAQFVNLQARRFGTVVIENTFDPFDRGSTSIGLDFTITATDFGAPFGIKTFRAACVINDGTLVSNSPVQSIVYDGVTENDDIFRGFPVDFGEFDITVLGRLGSLTTTESNLSMNGIMLATSFGVIQSADEIRGSISGASVLVRGFDPTTSIDSIRAQDLIDLNVNVLNGIAQIVVGEIDSVNIVSGWIGTAVITGSSNTDGQLRDSSIVLNSTTLQRSRALDLLTVSGEFGNTTFSVLSNNVGTLNFNGGIDNTGGGAPQFLVGVTDAGLLFSGNPFSANTFSINRLNIRQTIGTTANTWQSGVIAAFAINTIFANARIDDANGGTLFGLVFSTTNSITVRQPDGVNFTNTGGSFASGDFRIRNI